MALALLTGKASGCRRESMYYEGSHAPLDIMDTLFMGRTLSTASPYPRAYTIHQVAQAVGQTGIVRREDFWGLWRWTLRAPPPSGSRPPPWEGFLFPDTYFLVPRSTPLEIASKMIKGFRKAFTEEMRPVQGISA